jgi:hypothetical protein
VSLYSVLIGGPTLIGSDHAPNFTAGVARIGAAAIVRSAMAMGSGRIVNFLNRVREFIFVFFLSLRLLFHLLKRETAAKKFIERKNFCGSFASSEKQPRKTEEVCDVVRTSKKNGGGESEA